MVEELHALQRDLAELGDGVAVALRNAPSDVS